MCRKIMQIIWACELSDTILCCVLMNGIELCPDQACELSWAYKLAMVKLSGDTVLTCKVIF